METPRKETLKEKLREESIWIMFIIFFGFIFLWTISTFAGEMNYVINGTKVSATVTKDKRALYTDEAGNPYSIGLTNFMIPRGTKDKINLYYFKSNPEKAIVLSPWMWWVICFGLCIFFLIWSGYMLYKNFRGERHIRSNYVYAKKKLDGVEIGRALSSNMSYYNRDLYERHKNIEKEDIIKLRKTASEKVREILEQQDKIWSVASVYLAVFKGEDKLVDGIRNVIITNANKYINNPDLFYEEVNNTEDVTTLPSTCELTTYISCEMLPYKGQENRFYLAIAKPGISEYALMLPEWYYMREELENF